MQSKYETLSLSGFDFCVHYMSGITKVCLLLLTRVITCKLLAAAPVACLLATGAIEQELISNPQAESK